MSGLPHIPLPLLTDSYKLTHTFLYPAGAKKACAYGEFRSSFLKDPVDHRLVFYGLSYFLKQYLSKPITRQDLDVSLQFIKTHMAGFKPFPFPLALFEKVLSLNGGYFPVKVEALLEGTVAYPHIPVIQFSAEGEFTPLVTYLETLFTMIWVFTFTFIITIWAMAAIYERIVSFHRGYIIQKSQRCYNFVL